MKIKSQCWCDQKRLGIKGKSRAVAARLENFYVDDDQGDGDDGNGGDDDVNGGDDDGDGGGDQGDGGVQSVRSMDEPSGPNLRQY